MAKNETTEAPAFTREQLMASNRYANQRDIIKALLETGKLYTFAQVDGLIEKFKKGKVK